MSMYDEYEEPRSGYRSQHRSSAFTSQGEGGSSVLGNTVRSTWNLVNHTFGQMGEEFVGQLAGAAAVKAGVKNPEKVQKFAGAAAREAVLFAANLNDLRQGLTSVNQVKNGVLKDVGMFLNAEFEGSFSNVNPTLALMRSQNEVVQVAAGKVMGEMKISGVKVASGLIEKVPMIADRTGLTTKATDKMTHLQATDANGKKVGLDKEAAAGLLHNTIGGISPWLQDKLVGMTRSKFDEETSLELIKSLAKQVKESPKSFTDESGGRELAGMVMDIFKTHQKNMGDPPLTERARGYEDMEKAATMIADEIRDGKLNPMGLVALVGERKVLTKEFRVAKEEVVKKAILDVEDMMDRHQDVKVRDFLANTAYTPKELKVTIDALEGENKAFFAQMFPRKVLKAAGFKPDEIKEMRKTARDGFDANVMGVVTELSGMDPKELRDSGFGPSDIKKLQLMAESIDPNDPTPASTFRRDGHMDTALGILTGVESKGKTGWQQRVTLGRQTAVAANLNENVTEPDETQGSELQETNRVQHAGKKRELTHVGRIKKGGDSHEIALST